MTYPYGDGNSPWVNPSLWEHLQNQGFRTTDAQREFVNAWAEASFEEEKTSGFKVSYIADVTIKGPIVKPFTTEELIYGRGRHKTEYRRIVGTLLGGGPQVIDLAYTNVARKVKEQVGDVPIMKLKITLEIEAL